MFSVLTNAETILIGELRRIQTLHIVRPVMVAEAALATRNAVAERIHDQGLNSAGQLMRTSARNADGAYSRRHAKARRKRGRQIGRVDFTFSGDLMRDWAVVVRANNSVVLAIRTEESLRKVDELDREFGPTFEPTAAEIALGTAVIEKRTNELFR